MDKNYLIIMDNADIHKSKKIKKCRIVQIY